MSGVPLRGATSCVLVVALASGLAACTLEDVHYPRRDAGGADASVLDASTLDASEDAASACVAAIDCPTRAGASAACTDGACVYACDTGRMDCDGRDDNGCEADLAAPETCGTCSMHCPDRAGAAATCTAGICGTECLPGFGDCDMTSATGCERSLETVTDCRGCGVACLAGEYCSATGCRRVSVRWTRVLSGVGAASVSRVAVDASRRVYAGGAVDGPTDFGGGVAAITEQEFFLAQYTDANAFRWVHRAGSGAEVSEVKGIAFDAADNVYACGVVDGPADLGGGTTPAGGDGDGFVVSYGATGGYRWSRRFGSAGDSSRALAVAAGASGVVHFAGVGGTFDLDGMGVSGSSFLATAASDTGAVSSVLPTPGATIVDLVLDDTSALRSIGKITAGGDLGGGPIAAVVGTEGYAATYDSDTTLGTVVRMTGATPIAVAACGGGTACIVGTFTGTLGLGGSPLVAAGASDIFVGCFAADGGLLWSGGYGSASTTTTAEMATAITCDSVGNVYVAGLFTDPMDFGGETLRSLGSYDAFVASFDSRGTYRWARRDGGTAGDFASAIAVDSTETVYVGGSFQGTVTFDATPVTASGPSDGYILALVQ